MREAYRVSGKKNWGKKSSMQSNCHFLTGKGEERFSGGSPEKREIRTQRDENSQDLRMGRRDPAGDSFIQTSRGEGRVSGERLSRRPMEKQ